MRRREPQLFQVESLLAAVYFDPMNRVLLNEDQCAQAKDFICKLIRRIENKPAEEQHPPSPEAQPRDVTAGVSFEEYLDIEESQKRKRRRLENEQYDDTDVPVDPFIAKILSALREVETYDRTNKLSVHDVIPLYPEIVQYPARRLTALPSTQVSVERLFSALKIVKSDLRANMKQDLLGAILFLRAIE